MEYQEIIDKYRKLEPFFGNWYIKRFIGAGGFANVFEITRKDFGEEYVSALKIVTVSMSEADVKERRSQGMTMADIRGDFRGIVQDMVNEIKLMYKLKSCPAIMAYEDHALIESEDGLSCYILIKLELLTSLSDYIIANGGKIEERMLLKLGIDMCKALEMCQKHKIIHRDIKFENVFISPAGDFKLGDFGIARIIEAQNAGLSKKGTTTYMAPEVYKGLPYDSSVDIYSLGMVLYRLLNNNRAPFTPTYPAPISLDERDEAMRRRMSGEKLPAPNEMQSGRLAEIVLKACAYTPEDRYFSPGAMRADLEAILYEKGELTEWEPYIRIFDVQQEPEEQDELGVTEVLAPGPAPAAEAAPVKPVAEEERPKVAVAKETAAKETAPVKKAAAGKKKWWIPVAAVLLLLVVGIGIGYYILTNDFTEITPSHASKNLEYELNSNGESYTLTGVGRCTDTDIIIPETYDGWPVTYIADEVFRNHTEVESVEVPDSVKGIGDYAFSGCEKLWSIKLSDDLDDIGKGTFENCSALTEVELPENLEVVEEKLFYNCDALEQITIPERVGKIAGNAFDGCDSLEQIRFEAPDGWYREKTFHTGENIDFSNAKEAAAFFRENGESKFYLKDTGHSGISGQLPTPSGEPEQPKEPERPDPSGEPEEPRKPERPTPSGEPEQPKEPERPDPSGKPEQPKEPTATPKPTKKPTVTPKPTQTPAKKQGRVLNIFCWDTSMAATMAKHYPGYKKVDDYTGRIGDVTVNWMISTYNDYQNELNSRLITQPGGDESIDMFLLDADFTENYVNSGFALPISELGITKDDISGQYPYTQEIMTDGNDRIMGLSMQACPGVMFYRRDIAKQVFGTDDPEVIQNCVKDWETYKETAQILAMYGYQMTATAFDTYRVYRGSVTTPWITEDRIVIDGNLLDWAESSKLLVDTGCTTAESLWGDKWNQGLYQDGNVFCYFGPAWLVNNSMATDQQGSVARAGGWAAAEGPQSFYWGGTWMCAADGTDNKELIREIMLTLTTDKDVMLEIAKEDNEFVNNKAAMEMMAKDRSYKSAVLGGQNPMALYCKSAENIRMEYSTAYDQFCNNTYQSAMYEYFVGSKTLDEAVELFFGAVKAELN